MKRLELATLGVGSLLMIAAFAAVDWRLGLFGGGFLLTLSAVDLPRTRP